MHSKGASDRRPPAACTPLIVAVVFAALCLVTSTGVLRAGLADISAMPSPMASLTASFSINTAVSWPNRWSRMDRRPSKINSTEDSTPKAEEPAGAKWSSLETHNTFTIDPRQPVEYHVLHNVLVRNRSIVLFSDVEAKHRPKRLRVFHTDGAGDGTVLNVHVNVRYQTVPAGSDDPFASCSSWIEEPAMLFWIPWEDNVYHFLTHGVAGIFQALSETGNLPATVARVLSHARQGVLDDAAPEQNCTFDAPAPGVALFHMSWRQGEQTSKMRYLLDPLGSVRPWEEANGTCLRTLVVGTSRVLDFYVPVTEPEKLQRRSAAWSDYQQFLVRSALANKVERLSNASAVMRRSIIQQICGPQSLTGRAQARSRWRSGGPQPRVTLASRKPGRGRGVCNEGEIVAFIRQRYDVEVVTADFRMPFWEALALVHSTDVFMGMHGAGFANLLGMHKDTTVVQLIPYGWEQPDGSVIREPEYAGMAAAANASYWLWVNPDEQNAFLHRSDFRTHEEEWRGQHPDAYTSRPRGWDPRRWWIYQDTEVNMTSLGPVLEAAFAATGIEQRSAADTAQPVGPNTSAEHCKPEQTRRQRSRRTQ